MIGITERRQQDREDIDEEEAAILSEALIRCLRGPSCVDRLRQIRNNFPTTPKNTIWFAAIAPIARMKAISFIEDREIDYFAILSAIVEKSQRGEVAPASAAALLYIATNETFLRVSSIRSAVERANLHLLVEAMERFKLDPLVSQLAPVVAADVANVIGWVGTLATQAIPVDTAPVPIVPDITWLSFEAPQGQIAQLVIEPPTDARFTVVDSSNRVSSERVTVVRASRDSKNPPMLIYLRTEQSGRNFVRLSLPPLREPTTASIQLQSYYRATDLPPPSKGAIVDIKAGSSVTIETKGDDEAWLRLNAKAGVTYILRTLGLNSAEADTIDTVIEVYDRERANRLTASDDDGGEVDNGEKWSSLVSITPKQDSIYHVRIQNIESTRGTFVFTVFEKQSAAGDPTTPL